MGKRLFEEMLAANHRALEGDPQAGLHPADYADELPLVALTCVDARLNALLPQALGVPPEQFIWLRNAGNIITGAMSSTMRSLALACAVKGGKEIAIIGHTDCQVGKTTTMQLIGRFRALGIERHMLPDNLNEYFGIFGSDRQNVIKAVEFVRGSPLIGPKVPVQGLLVDIETGRLEWLVNGYETLGATGVSWNQLARSAGQALDALKPLTGFNLGNMQFPDGKIGEIATAIGGAIARDLPPSGPLPQISLPAGFSLGDMNFPQAKIGEAVSQAATELLHKLRSSPEAPMAQARVVPKNAPPKIPLPPPIAPKNLRRNPR